MASITIRRLEESTKQRLRMRASRNKRSMEEEARQILKAALSEKAATGSNLAESIRKKFAPLGGLNLPDFQRDPMRVLPDFDK